MNPEEANTHDQSLLALLDRIVIVMGVLNLLATMPQLLTIYLHKNAGGVSSLSWGYYFVFTAVLLTYGILHKDKPIIATYSGSTIMYFAIFVGSILY